MNGIRLSGMVLLALTATAAPADEIYKSTLPDGRIVYGESPFPGSTHVRKITAPGGDSGITVVTPAEKARGAASGGASSPAVSVMQTKSRPPTAPATRGRSSPRGEMSKRDY